MGARQREIASRIKIWARRPEIRRELAQKQWCDEASDELQDACAGSELIVLCAPVEKIIAYAKELSTLSLEGHPIVTDVGSVKSLISRDCTRHLSGHARFVGSHPMAGSEKTGMDNAQATLFENRTCFVTPYSETDQSATESTIAFWEMLGSTARIESPENHDAIVAKTSHLPHIVASALAVNIGKAGDDAIRTCGNGLKDTTRIASGDPQMWREIIAQNRDEILRSLSSFDDEMQRFRSAIENENYFEVAQKLADGKSFRDKL